MFEGFLEDHVTSDTSASKVVESRGKSVSISLHVTPVPYIICRYTQQIESSQINKYYTISL